MENVMYLDLGEEPVRGTAQKTTIGTIPLLTTNFPVFEPDDRPRGEVRGEESVLGDTLMIRHSAKWSWDFEIPFFCEAGTTIGMIGTLMKHFFGKVTTAENASTGQFNHSLYGVANPFATANLGTKALTCNVNVTEGSVVKNWPFFGGRVTSLSLIQEAGEHLKLGVSMVGQGRDASTTAIASPVYPPENQRCDYNNLTLYSGTITPVGTGPDYTGFTYGSADTIKPESMTLKLENGMVDNLRCGGVLYPDKTRMGKFSSTLDVKIDLEAPGSGFDSVAEYNNWVDNGETEQSFNAYWNTGVVAGTAGDNYGLFADMPKMSRMGGDITRSLDDDPMVDLSYKGLYDASTALYMVMLLLRNEATAL
ncbi:MAG: hypothetical protein KAR06_00720 [Deltaproteobacteria bacterium]|nr:hypothetical protein [Deltaproteobacteria bacterium]